MTTTLEAIAVDLAPFADLGTRPPFVVEGPRGSFVQLTRHGDLSRVELTSNGLKEIVANDPPIKHASFKSLLASDRYGALRNWAAQQASLLRPEFETSKGLIEQTGTINGNIEESGIGEIDALLNGLQPEGTTHVLLIDGPAGIGKTNLITHLALRRSEGLLVGQAPLILHVESRGRQLSYITDLIAFSLQRLRSTVTFDQIPTLVKHGLITIAIDGFDELADPSGYSLAWAQVNELVQSVRGQGSLILAGRETFIGRERVLRDIKTLRQNLDLVDALTLTPPSPGKAKEWLKSRGVSEEDLSKIEGLLERGSLALRPFFLTQIADPAVISKLGDTDAGNALHFLIEAMIARESSKFGGEVSVNLTSAEQVKFVRSMMYEVARDMADNQTVAISEQTLFWLVEVAIPKDIPDTTVALLKHRSQYLAFLTLDSRPRHLRFYHEKFLEYFIARVIIDAISQREIPKFLTRNLFGSSFFETFGSVLEAQQSAGEAQLFHEGAIELLRESAASDRARRNLAALMLATLHLVAEGKPVELSDIEIDEARIVGTAASTIIRGCIVSQLDARDTDCALITFDNTSIFTLIVNEDTLFKDDGAKPSRLVVVGDGNEQVLSEQSEISSWLLKHSLNPPEVVTRLLPPTLYDHPAVRLLDRATRMRQYWLRRGNDKFADRILSDSYWPMIEPLLESNGLLHKEVRDASGTDATFYHIRYANDILSEDRNNANIVKFYADLKDKLLAN